MERPIPKEDFMYMPPQKVSTAKKNTNKWQQDCINALLGMASGKTSSGRTLKEDKQINYNLVNSIVDLKDFQHVLNPYGLEAGSKLLRTPVKMQNYNIIAPKIKTLIGEEMKMPINYRAVAVNGAAALERNTEIREAILEAMKSRISAIVQGDINPETGQPNAPDPTEVAIRMKTEYANPTEIACNQLLEYIIQDCDLKSKFSNGWSHGLVASEEIYYLSIVGGRVDVRVVNPLYFEMERDTSDPLIHNASWAFEERWIPASQVIDEYGEYLKDADVKAIDEGQHRAVWNDADKLPGTAFDSFQEYKASVNRSGNMNDNPSHVYVADCCWRSYVKRGRLKYLDPRTNRLEMRIVEDDFEFTDEMVQAGSTIEWFWETEIWKGTKIGNDLYVNVGPMENQTGNLPYVGYVYNNQNSIATSFVEMVKPYQYTNIIMWYRLEQEIAKAKGKKFVMDLAQLPKSKGMTMDQWTYYFDNIGIAYINSREEGRKNDPQSVANFNQFQSIDMTLSQSVQQYLAIIAKLESSVASITGVSSQREGDIGRSETATGAQRAIIQSTNNTKPLFYFHDVVKKEVLTELLELCKVAYIDGTQINHVVDESTIETIKIDGDKLFDTDFGVFLKDSFEEAESIQKLEQYLSIALQQDKVNLSNIIELCGEKSLSKMKDVMINGEREKIMRDQQAQQSQQQMAQQATQAQMKAEQDRIELEIYKAKLDADTKIVVAEIKAEVDLVTDDGDKNEIESRKVDLQEKELEVQERLKEQEIQTRNKVS